MVSFNPQDSIFSQPAPQQQYMPPPVDNQLYDENGLPLFQQQSQASSSVFPNADQGFLKWLFSFTTESLEPLENYWRGKQLNELGQWVYPGNKKPENTLMNDKGVNWAISLLRSYFNPVFFVTSLDARNYNFRMRQTSEFILHTLYYNHKEYGIDTTNIPRVAEEIESKIAAILSGALENGYRVFLSTQNQNIETRNLSSVQTAPSGNIFQKGMSMFKKDGGQQTW